MKRRSFQRLWPNQRVQDHHHVYVVLLDPAVARLRKVQAENPARDPVKPCVCVGMPGLTPEERLANHKRGDKAASVVERYGIRLLPELYAHLNPMPSEAAAEMERDLAEDFAPGRVHGYRRALIVAGGNLTIRTSWPVFADQEPAAIETRCQARGWAPPRHRFWARSPIRPSW